MIKREAKVNGCNLYSYEFKSISEFYDFITTSESNSYFKGDRKLDSKGTSIYDQSFTMTASFEEATELLKFGWQEKARELEKAVKAKKIDADHIMKSLPGIDVAGFQPVVPLFMMGVPASMATRKMVAKKEKVVTLNKSISYKGVVSASTWMDESIKALAIVKKLEASGVRCNINVCRGIKGKHHGKDCMILVKVRVKSANERLNISKLAFPMCHPSMQRRMMFRFTEVCEETANSSFANYGYTFRNHDFRACFDLKKKGKEFLLPSFIDGDVEKDIKCVSDLEKLSKDL